MVEAAGQFEKRCRGVGSRDRVCHGVIRRGGGKADGNEGAGEHTRRRQALLAAAWKGPAVFLQPAVYALLRRSQEDVAVFVGRHGGGRSSGGAAAVCERLPGGDGPAC